MRKNIEPEYLQHITRLISKQNAASVPGMLEEKDHKEREV